MAFVGKQFGALQNLSDLNLSKNKIKEVDSDCLTELKGLVLLDLHQNQLTSFTSVPLSAKLDTLNLAFNFITSIENLHNAPKLTVLDLHNNKLTEFPESIVDLKEIKTLRISNNDLGDINPRISLLPNLVRINIEGNPLKCIKSSMRNANAD